MFSRSNLFFENEDDRKVHTGPYLPKVEIKDDNVMNDGNNLLYQAIKSNMITDDNIWKVSTGQGDDYTTICSLDYPFLKENYKLIAIDLSKNKH